MLVNTSEQIKKKVTEFIEKINVKFFIIAVVQFLATFFLDKFIFLAPNFYHNWKYLLLKSFTFVVLVWFWQLVAITIKKVREKSTVTRVFLKSFLLYFSIMLIFLFLTWPGVWRFDEFQILSAARFLDFFYWQHWLTSLFYMFSISIFPFPAGIVIVQLFIISLTVSYVVSQTYNLYSTRLAALFFLFFLFPSVVVNNLYPMRLPLYSFIELFLFSYIIFKYLNNAFLSKRDFFIIVSLTSIVATWRAESAIYIICLPLLIGALFYKKTSKKYLINLFLVIAIFASLIVKIQFDVGTNNWYRLTAIITPLSEIVKHDFRSSDKEKDLAVINKVFDVERIQKNSGMMVFWTPGTIKNTNLEDIKKLELVYIKIVLNNFELFWNERFNLFKYSVGFVKVRIQESDPFYQTLLQFPNNKSINNPSRLEIIKNLENAGVFFYNPLIPLCIISVLMVVLLLCNSSLFLIPFFIIIQTLLTIFTAPVGFFMYYLPCYLCSYTFFILLLIHFIKNRHKPPSKHSLIG